MAKGHNFQLASKNGSASWRARQKKYPFLIERMKAMGENSKEAQRRIYGPSLFINRVIRTPRGVQKGTVRGPYKKRVKQERGPAIYYG
jgi:hypothetical protein